MRTNRLTTGYVVVELDSGLPHCMGEDLMEVADAYEQAVKPRYPQAAVVTMLEAYPGGLAMGELLERKPATREAVQAIMERVAATYSVEDREQWLTLEELAEDVTTDTVATALLGEMAR